MRTFSFVPRAGSGPARSRPRRRPARRVARRGRWLAVGMSSSVGRARAGAPWSRAARGGGSTWALSSARASTTLASTAMNQWAALVCLTFRSSWWLRAAGNTNRREHPCQWPGRFRLHQRRVVHSGWAIAVAQWGGAGAAISTGAEAIPEGLVLQGRETHLGWCTISSRWKLATESPRPRSKRAQWKNPPNKGS